MIILPHTCSRDTPIHSLSRMAARDRLLISHHRFPDIFAACTQGNKEPFVVSDEDIIREALHLVLDATPDRLGSRESQSRNFDGADQSNIERVFPYETRQNTVAQDHAFAATDAQKSAIVTLQTVR